MSKDRLVGTWRLLSSEIQLAGGTVIHPLGEDSQGLLILNSSGTLAAQLMRPGRPAFASGDLLGGTAEEIEAAYKGYIAFYGKYDVDESDASLSYTVDGSLFPNWIGHPQQRFYELDGDQLILRTPPMLVGGVEGQGVLKWQREE